MIFKKWCDNINNEPCLKKQVNKKIKKIKKSTCIILPFVIECRSTADFKPINVQVNGLVAQVVRAHAW